MNIENENKVKLEELDSGSKIEIKDFFTKEIVGNIFDSVEWEKADIDIADDNGNPLFVQKDAEFPSFWSPLARKITCSKYFFGEKNSDDREGSLKDLIWRVTSTMKDWALKYNYFKSEADYENFERELTFINLNQLMAFNSPVWFNVGAHKVYKMDFSKSKEQKESYVIEDGEIIMIPKGRELMYPQTSACFIQSVDDTMEDIMELAKKEALLFKYGSGSGSNISTLRSSREKLSGGGTPSGPLAYWTFWDKVAGIVKSGGKTRRAAKMDILNITHPDILEFINSKSREEEKMHMLIDNGVDWMEATETVSYQNTNISVRISDDFMNAVLKDEKWKTVPVHNNEMADEMPEYSAKMLLGNIAKGTHFCGDPGVQFDDVINKWHTCPNSGKINASNPCSEYMFVDNSSCNLASLNLMRFLKDDNSFDVDSFSNVVRLTAIAQDLLIDNSSYPTKEIADNSHKFRPLGMGYANLGSLLMSMGLAYDSDAGRAVAAVITAALTGRAYETSTELAESIGPFEEFSKNKDPMLNVIRMHRNALVGIDRNKLPNGFLGLLEYAEKVWDSTLERGEKYGFRNAQATVLAPTGTIGFMMDCDTKGIEPEIGLVQVKLLSDGGVLKLVNGTVERALGRLGYSSSDVSKILEHIEKEETIEGSMIKDEHLSIFDCANKPKNGNRTVSCDGHLKMMAAAQPFLSGAISKTVNLSEEASVEDIEAVYMDAWRLGLKAVALYRDGSKRFQPLSFSKKDEEDSDVLEAKPARVKLPNTRASLTHKFNVGGHEGYLTFGLYPNGQPGELFITMNKEGSTIGGLMDTLGTLVSISLQYGVPVEDMIKKFRHQKFEPKGIMFSGHKNIKTAESIVDYIGQFMEKVFVYGETDVEIEAGVPSKEKLVEEELSGELGGFCSTCGTQMIKRGHCLEECPSCHNQSQNGCGS
ncbi:MAG: vitamin B12-dependent ribonucleotide reductase [Nitrososphaerales archaeon]|jgi:ribonucleoside-diphosphate reductase alpha chain|nr:vitamin B12-dependent ribonucleotide reductase [Nitrososphaerales archaeon]